jgi:hypothetical protein
MTVHYSTNGLGASSTIPTTISGRWFSRHRKDFSPTELALLAHDIEMGKKMWADHTRAQALALTKASAGYTASVAKLTPGERKQVEQGQLLLSKLHNKQMSDTALDRFIARVGADRVMAAIDRYTQPSRCAVQQTLPFAVAAE